MVIHPVSIPSITCAASALVLSVRFLGELPRQPIDSESPSHGLRLAANKGSQTLGIVDPEAAAK